MEYKDAKIEDLLGKTLVKIEKLEDDKELIFHTETQSYKMFHEQSCCECVYIEDICGDLDDLLGSPIVEAESVGEENGEIPEGVVEQPEYEDSYTWTFYKLRTAKGCVTIRWFGESNGCYSEEVSFFLVEGDDQPS